MHITAVLACRNEEEYLENCLDYLTRQGIDFCIVDNDSTDGSMDIAHMSRFKEYFLQYRRVSYRGEVRLAELLDAKARLIEMLRADWILNVSPDEVLHTNDEGMSLVNVAEESEAIGCNVVNFDEFVFLPLECEYVKGLCTWQPLRHYYFFENQPNRLMRLWRNGLGFSNVAQAGHRLKGADIKLYPESMVLRHYVVRNQTHACNKYTGRVYSKEELEKGWHRNRHGIPFYRFRFPRENVLERLTSPCSFEFNRMDPWRQHYWEVEELPRRS